MLKVSKAVFYQTFDSRQKLSKAIFDFRQVQYTFDVYQRWSKVLSNIAIACIKGTFDDFWFA